MIQYNGMKAEKASLREMLPPGGYVVKVLGTNIECYKNKNGGVTNVLIISFDIEDGEYRKFFERDYKNNQSDFRKWRGLYRLTIPVDDGSRLDGFAKSQMNNFIWAIEESNKFHFDGDETKLVGKLFGVLIRRKEWSYNGKTGWMSEAAGSVSIQNIADGDYTVPKDKPLPAESNQTVSASAITPAQAAPFTPSDEDDNDLPF